MLNVKYCANEKEESKYLREKRRGNGRGEGGGRRGKEGRSIPDKDRRFLREVVPGMLRPCVQMPVEMPEGHGRPGKFLRVLQVVVPGRFRPFGFSGPGF